MTQKRIPHKIRALESELAQATIAYLTAQADLERVSRDMLKTSKPDPARFMLGVGLKTEVSARYEQVKLLANQLVEAQKVRVKEKRDAIKLHGTSGARPPWKKLTGRSS